MNLPGRDRLRLVGGTCLAVVAVLAPSPVPVNEPSGWIVTMYSWVQRFDHWSYPRLAG